MNKNIKTILTTAAIALVTGCVTAGTWVNGCYIDGPLCMVCDGMKVVAHTYGTTVCTHCDGTGIEPPEETVVVENVIVDTWCPAPPPPPPRWHHPRPHGNHKPPRAVLPPHGGGGHHNAKPAPRGGTHPPQRAARPVVPQLTTRPAAKTTTRPPAKTTTRPAAKTAARPAAPRGGGIVHGGGRGPRR